MSTNALRASFAVLFLLWQTPIAEAQSPGRVRDPNFNSWWVYSGDHRINDKWGVYIESQLRLHDFAKRIQQFQSRDAVTYRLSDNAQIAAGYVYTFTGRYGDFPAPWAFGEHRTYQQLALKHAVNQLEIEHRYRVEQRWIENTVLSADKWRFQNRFRYQLRASIPVNKRPGQPWYLFAGDELLIAFGANSGASNFDQNRAFAGIGYKVTPRNRFEVGYMNQFILQRNGRIEENNHTLRVQFSSSVPLATLFGR